MNTDDDDGAGAGEVGGSQAPVLPDTAAHQVYPEPTQGGSYTRNQQTGELIVNEQPHTEGA